MNKHFIPYELALELHELGFDEYCLSNYCKHWKDIQPYLWELRQPDYHEHWDLSTKIGAPLWQQAFDWFRDKYNYHHEIFLTNETPYDKFHYRIMQIGKYFTLSYDDFEGTYEETRQVCLEKLIKLCENN